VETEADQLSGEVTTRETHHNNINWDGKILPEQTTDASHPVCARNKATGVLQEHNYLALLRQHYLNINT
jgi:hypothetical protein